MLKPKKAFLAASALAAGVALATFLLTLKAAPPKAERVPDLHRSAIYKAKPIAHPPANDPTSPIVPASVLEAESGGFAGTGDQSGGSWSGR